MRSMKRAPLGGRIIYILIIISLLITLGTSIYYANACAELKIINNDLHTTLNTQISTITNLEGKVEDLSIKNEELEATIKKLTGNSGKFRITAYCSCSTCCGQWAGGPTASGTIPQAGRTIAVDPKIIPLGTKVLIDGHTYIAEDTGGVIKGNRIDMYFDSHQQALNWGVQYKDVKIIQ